MKLLPRAFSFALMILSAVSLVPLYGEASIYPDVYQNQDFAEVYKSYFPFPDALYSSYVKKQTAQTRMRPCAALSREQAEKINSFKPVQSLLLNNDIFAFYGNPRSKRMGILGEYSLSDLEPILLKYAQMYCDENSERGVIPALYLIYGTCWPEGEIGYLPDSIVKTYIEYAAERGWIVFLDHQIGKYGVEESVRKMLPYLKYPNVHLAIDPEWRTVKPMQEIGSVTGDEVNAAQQIIQDYMIENGIIDERLLVVHQFKPKMIRRSENVKSDYKMVRLIHCADGFGSPELKKITYSYNARAQNIPLKAFKLFFETSVEGAGFDYPLMTPSQVLTLSPRPCLIMYQ